MMKKFQVGFYKDVFKNGAYNFEECNKWEAIDAEFAANKFADYAFHNLKVSELGCDDFLNEDYEKSWDEDKYSVIVKDKDGNISRFSVSVDMEIVFNCNEIAI